MTGSWLETLADGAAGMGCPLGAGQLSCFAQFVDELKRWNRRINLTAITSDREIVVKHLLDSLTLTSILPPTGRLLDIGSGGGFPAIPLAIVLPGLSITSVDAVGKKITFQRHIGRLLSLTNLTAIHARAETLADTDPAVFDWVVSRAFSSIPLFARLALPVLKQDGTIVAMKGREGEQEAAAAETELAGLGLRVARVNSLHLPGDNASRTLVLIQKSGTGRLS
jgi:16S rRNA (guanine527-N7)-methyltransferase